MKILYLITKSNWGGAQKYVFDLAKNIKESGEDVMVAFGGAGILKERLENENINTFSIKALERDVNILKELSVFKEIYNILKKEKPDILHLNSSKIGIVGSLIGRVVGIKKIIFTAHGFPFREERPFWQVLLIKFLSWLSIIFSTKTICVSEKDYKDVENWPFVKNKIIVVHNGIENPDLPQPHPSRGENPNVLENPLLWRGQGEVDNEFINIVSIGELHKNKGFIYGIETINELKDKIQNFKYTIFSFGGDEAEYLKEKIKELNLENFIELKINKENHSQKLKDFDIYFMPSIKEGLPYVLLEAGINSLPIVASDTGGINEIVENYKNGFLIKPKDVNGFLLALERLINYKELRNEFGVNIKNKIISNFNLEKMLKETKEIYFD